MTSSNRLLTNERPGYEGKVGSYDNKVNPSDALRLKRLQRHQNGGNVYANDDNAQKDGQKITYPHLECQIIH